jgi:ArsR family transcriptional regulator
MPVAPPLLQIERYRYKLLAVPGPKLRLVQECRPRARPKPRDVRAHAALFKAVGDETRLEIVALLAEASEPLCACDIEGHFDLSQPTISHHLKVLRKAGWVASERRGTWIYYTLDREALARVEAFRITLAR